MSELFVDVRLARASFDLSCRHRFTGGFNVIVGPSGSGKSSLLDAVGGDASASGVVKLGEDTLVDTEHDIRIAPHRRRLPRAYQNARLFPHLTARENLVFGKDFGSPALGEDEVIESLGLGALLGRSPASLSGGERQRVALGRALLAPARAILLDEPLAAVDRERRRYIASQLRAWQQRLELPFLYVTHSAEEALFLGDEAIRMDEGRIVDEGEPARVLAHQAEFERSDRPRTLLRVEVEAHRREEGLTRLRWGDVRIEAAPVDIAEGELAVVSVGGDDIIVATEEPRALSARNILPSKTLGLSSVGAAYLADFTVDGAPEGAPALRTWISPAALVELRLEVGRRCWIVVKSSAIHVS